MQYGLYRLIRDFCSISILMKNFLSTKPFFCFCKELLEQIGFLQGNPNDSSSSAYLDDFLSITFSALRLKRYKLSKGRICFQEIFKFLTPE